MLTAAQFAEAINVPYPTVALWLRQKKIKGAEQLGLGGLKVWQIPAAAVDIYKDTRPKRGRPRKSENAKKASQKGQ